MDLRDEKLKDPKNKAGVLACDRWDHSQGEKILKDQIKYDAVEYGFGYVAFKVSLRDPGRKMTNGFEYVLNF